MRFYFDLSQHLLGQSSNWLSPRLAMLLLALLAGTATLSCSGPEQKDSPTSPTSPVTPTMPAQPQSDSTSDLPDGVSPQQPGQPQTVVPKLTNIAELRSTLGLTDETNGSEASNRLSQLKIAVLDNGFMGFEDSLGRQLPPQTKVIPGPGNGFALTDHGLRIAEVIYSLTTGENTYRKSTPAPQFYLINTNGYTNLEAAIQTVIDEQIDIVVYAQVWEYGGNFNGYGFINQLISQATRSGVIWLNASGNYGLTSRELMVSSQLPDGPIHQLSRQNGGQADLKIKVKVPKTRLRLVAAWSDFTLSKDHRADSDLDMVLMDKDRKVIATSCLAQGGYEFNQTVELAGTACQKNYSDHAREIIEQNLEEGEYFVRVYKRTFATRKPMQLRIVADGAGLEFSDGNPERSTLIPADHPDVFAVGAYDVTSSGRTYEGGRLVKPDIAVASRLSFSDGRVFYGTSAASAIAAAGVAVMAARTSDSFDVYSLRAILNKQNATAPFRHGYDRLPPSAQPCAFSSFHPSEFDSKTEAELQRECQFPAILRVN